MRVRRIEDGVVLDDTVRQTGGSLAWSLDARHLFYTRVDDAWRPHQVWRHEVGTPAEDDVLVHEETDERFFVGVGSSRDDRLDHHRDRVQDHERVPPARCRRPAGHAAGRGRATAGRRVRHRAVRRPAARHRTTRDRVNFELAVAPVTSTSADDWVPLVSRAKTSTSRAQRDSTTSSRCRCDVRAAPACVSCCATRPHRTASAQAHDIAVGEPIGTLHVGVNPEASTPTLQIVHESLVTPRTVEDYDVRSRAFTLLKQQHVRGDVDPAQYRQRREWATAADGTRIPISVVHRHDVTADGTAPGLLNAYGAYGISSDPWFSVLRLSLLDRGWVFAIAHVRGGSEMGRSWYDDGKLEAKPNTFTDFIACADHLVETGVVAPNRLAAEGGSAGGLLMGAVVNLAPERFRFVHAQVPFVDALTTMLDPSLPLTVVEWEEWGNPLEDPAAYALMKSYAPYENVRPTGYPSHARHGRAQRHAGLRHRAGQVGRALRHADAARWTRRPRSSSAPRWPRARRPVAAATTCGASGPGRRPCSSTRRREPAAPSSRSRVRSRRSR